MSTRPLSGLLAAFLHWSIRSRATASMTFLGALLLAVVSAVYGSGINLNTDLKALLPPDAPSVLALREASERRGPTDLLTIAIESEQPDVTQTFAADLAAVIATWPEVEEMRSERDFTVLRDHALYYLELDQLTSLRDELRQHKREALGESVRLGISDVRVPVEETLVGDDWDAGFDDDDDDDDSGPGKPSSPAVATATKPANPRKTKDDLRDWLAARRQSFVDDGRLSESEVDLIWPREDEDGKLVFPDRVTQLRTSPDGKIQVLQAQLSRPATELAFSRELSARVAQAIDDLRPTERHPSLRAMLVGSYEVSGEVNAVLVDLRRATWLSAALVLSVLVFAFRTWRAVIVVLVPLAVAMAGTLALARLIYGELNSLTAFLFAVLFGMGVDFAVHLVAQRERTPEESWPRLVLRHVRPLTAAMATTVASLWVLNVAHFKAFREFGLISGAGVFLCLVCAVLLVPVLDVLVGGTVRPLRTRHGLVRRVLPSTRVLAVLRGTTIVALVAVAFIGLPSLAFENNLRTLTAPTPPTAAARIHYGAALGDNRTSIPVVLLAENERDLETAIQRFRALAKPVAAASEASEPTELDKPWVKDALSPATLLPEAQAEKQPVLREILALCDDFRAELPDLPADDPAHAYASHLDALARLASAQPIDVTEMPDWTTRPFAERDKSLGRLGILYLDFRQHDLREVRRVVDNVREQLADLSVVAASSSFVYADLGAALESDAVYLPPLALLVIFVALAIDLRRVAATSRCFVALALGLASSLGIMGVVELHINFYNLVVMPAVIGLGIDASIHLWHADRHNLVVATSKATLVAGATTVAAFGGLLAAAHPGLRSIAQVGVLAIVCSLLAAFVVLVRDRRR